jgi:hypothetical protein
MNKLLGIVAMIVGLLGCVGTPANAAPIGPFCFSPLPFTDQFAFFFDSNGGNQFIGTGRNLSTGAAMSATVFVTQPTAVLSFVATIPATGTGHTFIGNANISLLTGSGPGRCETVNTGAGCGTGSSFTLTPIACPQGTTSDASARAEHFPQPDGPLMDGSK